jgi:hypothetical protein
MPVALLFAQPAICDASRRVAQRRTLMLSAEAVEARIHFAAAGPQPARPAVLPPVTITEPAVDTPVTVEHELVRIVAAVPDPLYRQAQRRAPSPFQLTTTQPAGAVRSPADTLLSGRRRCPWRRRCP